MIQILFFSSIFIHIRILYSMILLSLTWKWRNDQLHKSHQNHSCGWWSLPPSLPRYLLSSAGWDLSRVLAGVGGIKSCCCCCCWLLDRLVLVGLVPLSSPSEPASSSRAERAAQHMARTMPWTDDDTLLTSSTIHHASFSYSSNHIIISILLLCDRTEPTLLYPAIALLFVLTWPIHWESCTAEHSPWLAGWNIPRWQCPSLKRSSQIEVLRFQRRFSRRI